MADIALGTQTAASVIRPASFCGVYGFKPTFGTVSTAGVKPLAP
jgi:Asp-tRNA(Asn)/Glu-tRNA(Gln) amidotransferase A subunit family amidase